MYATRTDWRHGSASLAGDLFLTRGARVQVVRTSGLLFDAQFLVPVKTPAPTAHLFVLLEGWVDIEAAPDRFVRHVAPAVFCLARDEFEARTPGALRVRMGGEPRLSIELTMEQASMRAPIGARHGARVASAALVAAGARLGSSVGAPDERITALHALFDELAREDLCRAASPEPFAPHLERLLGALSGLYRVQNSGAYVALLSELATLSVRQLSRDMRQLARAALLPGTTLRELFRVLRLRRATLLASAADLTLAELAREAGYGSLDAMGRAFRDAGLPSPARVRAMLATPSDPAHVPAESLD